MKKRQKPGVKVCAGRIDETARENPPAKGPVCFEIRNRLIKSQLKEVSLPPQPHKGRNATDGSNHPIRRAGREYAEVGEKKQAANLGQPYTDIENEYRSQLQPGKANAAHELAQHDEADHGAQSPQNGFEPARTDPEPGSYGSATQREHTQERKY
jgi:hypothetical protein